MLWTNVDNEKKNITIWTNATNRTRTVIIILTFNFGIWYLSYWFYLAFPIPKIKISIKSFFLLFTMLDLTLLMLSVYLHTLTQTSTHIFILRLFKVFSFEIWVILDNEYYLSQINGESVRNECQWISILIYVCMRWIYCFDSSVPLSALHESDFYLIS